MDFTVLSGRKLLGFLDDEATRHYWISGHADTVFTELGPH